MKKLCVFLALIFVGCSSTKDSPDLDYPLTVINSGIEGAMTMGIQKVSENRRTFTSKPFVVKQSEEAKRSGMRERGIAEVTVLGDRRPYTLEVQVSIEAGRLRKNLDEIDYSFERYDKGLAKQLLNNIMAAIEKRGEGKNVIDDFRPF